MEPTANQWRLSLVVKQFINILINHSLFLVKHKNGSNFTKPVFLQYVFSSLMYQKVWFSLKILTEIDRILTYRKISKSESW